MVQFGLDAGPEGAAATNANSGSSTASVGTGASTVFAASAKAHGAFGLLATAPVNTNAYRRWLMAAPATTWSFSGVVGLPASAPTGPLVFFQFPNASGSARLAVRVESTGRIQVLGRASSSFHTLAEAADITWGAKYRVMLEVVGGSSTASSVVGKLFRESSPGSGAWTTQVGSTLNVSTVDTGTDAVVGVDAGVANTNHAGTSVGFDDLQLIDGSAVEIPDFVLPNDPPVVTAGAAQSVSAGATVTLAFTATDGDGSIASRATTFDYPTSGAPTITGGTTNAPSFTAGAAGSRYVVRHTATDNLGATGFATTEVFVPLAGSTTMRPEASNGTAVGSWARAGGAATNGQALSDESDATYLESPEVSATQQSMRLRLQPSAAKSSAQFKDRLWTDTGTATAEIRLYEGATLRQTWTYTVNTTPTEYTSVFSGATIAAISDWKNLYVQLTVTA